MNWLAGFEAPRPSVPAERPSRPMERMQEWKPGQRRATRIVICCVVCGSIRMKRGKTYQSKEYWRCDECRNTQHEPLGSSESSGHIARQ